MSQLVPHNVRKWAVSGQSASGWTHHKAGHVDMTNLLICCLTMSSVKRPPTGSIRAKPSRCMSQSKIQQFLNVARIHRRPDIHIHRKANGVSAWIEKLDQIVWSATRRNQSAPTSHADPATSAVNLAKPFGKAVLDRSNWLINLSRDIWSLPLLNQHGSWLAAESNLAAQLAHSASGLSWT